MGMIGTLIGLVQMLGSMNDPKQIAPAMAIALLATLYGAMIASTPTSTRWISASSCVCARFRPKRKRLPSRRRSSELCFARQSTTGAIMVSGHTDNVPVRSGSQYRSNWDLSAAHAASVGHELLGAGLDPARLMVSGHADTQPRVANDTTANRALNRRVDITFANGRERPGNWADPAPVPR